MHLAKAQKEALKRRDAAANYQKWNPSLISKRSRVGTYAFLDGRLKGNVIAVWATEKEILEKECDGQKPEQDFIGLCQLLESDENEGEQRCKVRLNFDKIFDGPDPRSQMWETMFHELVVSAYSRYNSVEMTHLLTSALARLRSHQL